MISRNRRDILFSVDRVVVQDKIKGEFNRLNLNRMVCYSITCFWGIADVGLLQLYVGGVPNIQEGLVVVQNFTGCIQNLYLNSTNLIREVKDAYSYGDSFKYEKFNTLYSCPVSNLNAEMLKTWIMMIFMMQEPPVIPVTFLTSTSFARLKGYEGMSSLNSSFAFRTYEQHGLMLYHPFSSSGYVAVSWQR